MKANSGISFERRLVLKLPLLVAAARGGGGASGFAGTGLGFSDFASACRRLAAELLDEGALDPDEYLLRLASLGAALDPGDVPRGELGAFGGYDPPVEFGPIHREVPIVIIQWRFAPGAVLPPHNHTPVHVLSLCLEGECRVRHFDVEGEAPPLDSSRTFRVRETENRLLRPGRSTSLTPRRDNIHTFEAGPEGALGFDVNTFLPGEGDWSGLQIDEAPARGYDRVFEARWIGKPGQLRKGR
jgi:hypothetical protein